MVSCLLSCLSFDQRAPVIVPAMQLNDHTPGLWPAQRRCDVGSIIGMGRDRVGNGDQAWVNLVEDHRVYVVDHRDHLNGGSPDERKLSHDFNSPLNPSRYRSLCPVLVEPIMVHEQMTWLS